MHIFHEIACINLQIVFLKIPENQEKIHLTSLQVIKIPFHPKTHFFFKCICIIGISTGGTMCKCSTIVRQTCALCFCCKKPNVILPQKPPTLYVVYSSDQTVNDLTRIYCISHTCGAYVDNIWNCSAACNNSSSCIDFFIWGEIAACTAEGI